MPRRRTRTLATVLFTDIVSSTTIAGELGDRRWRDLLRRHHALVRRELKRFGGRELDTAGDGFVASFESPEDAVRCAWAVAQAVPELGVEIRAGVHTGEAEELDGKLSGVAVHIAARLIGLAGEREIVASGTVKDLVAGARLRFDDRGAHRLKGVEGEWRVFAVASVDGTRMPPPLEAGEATRLRQAIAAPARRRWPWVVAASVVAAVAVVAFFALRPDERRAPPTPETDQIVAIDATSGETAFAARPLEARVGATAVGGGSVWLVTLSRDDGVVEIDTGSGEVVGRLDVEPRDLAWSGRSLWATSGCGGLPPLPGFLRQIDPEDGEPIGRRIELGPCGFVGEVEAIGNRVWAMTDERLFVVNGETGVTIDQARPSDTGSLLAAGEGALWVADDFGLLTKYDARTLEAIGSVDLGDVDALVAGEGAVWALNVESEIVTAIDPVTLALEDQIATGPEPLTLESGFGKVWIGSYGERTVTPVDALTREKERPVETGRVTMLVADEQSGFLWVATTPCHPRFDEACA